MKRIIVFFCLLLTISTLAQKGREYFEIKVYSLTTQDQSERLDQYLKEAYLPAMHRLGYKSIGVLKPLETDSTYGKKVYVLIAHSSLEKFASVSSQLKGDKEWQAKGKDYIEATHDQTPYKRIETILLRAFPLAPKMQTPKLTGPRSERFYELRSYEGPTEKRYENKVKMFNDGDEIGLFDRLNFNAVFYGEVLAGGRMPNLMYMTTFENKQARDEHWKAFVDDPQWKKLVADPQYQNNVSKNVQVYLRPTEYSDF